MARYANLDPAHVPHSAAAVFRWMVLDPLRGRRKIAAAGPPAPCLEPDLERVLSPSGPSRVTWIGHASFLCSLGGRHVLVDPVFSRRIATVVPRYGRPGLRPEQLPELSAVLITHNHYDHLDRPSLAALPLGVPAIVPRGMRAWFRRRHPSRRVLELDWWESATLGGLRVTLVPARHWSKRGFFDTNSQHWGGYVIEKDGAVVYHAGDSAWFDGFAKIGRRVSQPDVALLPIGAYEPAWFMEQQHMNPEQAIDAFEALGASAMVPMHWGAFQLTDEPISEPAARLRRAWSERLGDDPRLRVLAVGETAEFQGSPRD